MKKRLVIFFNRQELDLKEQNTCTNVGQERKIYHMEHQS